MEAVKSTYNLIFDSLQQNPFIYFIALVCLSFISAKVIDVIFISFFSRAVKKTKTKIDDTIIEVLHKPIYYSFLFIGLRFSISIDNINFSQNTIFIITGFLKTFAIVIWAKALFRVFILLFDWYSSKNNQNQLEIKDE